MKMKTLMEVYWQRRFAEEFVLWQRESSDRGGAGEALLLPHAPAIVPLLHCTCIHCIAPAIPTPPATQWHGNTSMAEQRGWWQLGSDGYLGGITWVWYAIATPSPPPLRIYTYHHHHGTLLYTIIPEIGRTFAQEKILVLTHRQE